jgi:hypothetical protein
LQARSRIDRWVCCGTKRQLLQASIVAGLAASGCLSFRCLAAEQQQQVGV